MRVCAVLASADIELYFYDELDPHRRTEIEQHLRTCGECRAALEELRIIRAVLAARPDVAEPAGGNWAPFMAGLESAIERERGISGFASTRPAQARHRHTMAYLSMAAVLALVTSTVLYVARRPAAPLPPPGAVVAAVPNAPPGPSDAILRAPSPEAALAALSEQHFERSKLVVLGLAAKDPRETSASDWAYERELASSLLDDTRLYRHAAQEKGLTTLAGVMSDLELVLLQTSMSEDRDAETLERLQRLIRKRDLVTRINVVSTSGI